MQWCYSHRYEYLLRTSTPRQMLTPYADALSYQLKKSKKSRSNQAKRLPAVSKSKNPNHVDQSDRTQSGKGAHSTWIPRTATGSKSVTHATPPPRIATGSRYDSGYSASSFTPLDEHGADSYLQNRDWQQQKWDNGKYNRKKGTKKPKKSSKKKSKKQKRAA